MIVPYRDQFYCVLIYTTLVIFCVGHAHENRASHPSLWKASRPLSGKLRPQQVRESPDLLQNQSIPEEEDDGLIETLQTMIDVLTEGVYRVSLTI